MSVASAGCLLWLQQWQPLFAVIALTTLAYQAWLVWRRPPQRRTRSMLAILWTSLACSMAVAVALAALAVRYW